MEDPMDASELMAELVNENDKCGPTHRKRAASLDVEVLGAAASDVCILFTGTGSAKELAHRIHSLGRGRPGRFRAVDCGWPEALLEQQLFYVLRPGSGGTIFLEEVGRLNLQLQARLLDALGGPVGLHTRTRPRVMASTSEPLLQRVIEGSFNERLFYRLNAIHVILPPDLGEG
jgi:transcriptional regulator with PAS, ATPase and Fis domain